MTEFVEMIQQMFSLFKWWSLIIFSSSLEPDDDDDEYPCNIDIVLSNLIISI